MCAGRTCGAHNRRSVPVGSDEFKSILATTRINFLGKIDKFAERVLFCIDCFANSLSETNMAKFFALVMKVSVC